MSNETPSSMMQPRQTRRRRLAPAPRGRASLIALGLGIAALLAVLWSGLWYLSATVADRTLAGWVEREAAAGRIYACGEQTIDGFPLSIRAHCTNATIDLKNTEPPYTAKTGDITFVAAVYHPTRLIGTARGPATLAAPGEPPSLRADWSKARLVVRGVPPDPQSIAVDFDAPQLERIGGAASDATMFKAERANVRARLIGGAPQDRPVIEMTLRLGAGQAPALHPLLTQPTTAELEAVVRGFKDLAPKPWAERFREMQANGGAVEIKSLRLAQGNAVVVGAGTLGISADGKVSGLMRVAIVGIEDLVPLLAVDRLISQSVDKLAGGSGTLDRLLPGLGNTLRATANENLADNLKRMGEPTSIDNRPAVMLPLRFVDGGVYLGLLRVGELPPLF